MSNVELSPKLFDELAGWEAVKQARGIVASGRVLNSEWEPPLLKGTVQAGTTTYKAGLVLKSKFDVENICPCRDSRERGIICAHAVAVGLHFIEARAKPSKPALPASAPQPKPVAAVRPVKALKRSGPGEPGEPLQISIILPPNLPDALTRGKLMLVCEGQWKRGRSPLNSLPFDVPFSLDPADSSALAGLEKLNGGDTPGILMLDPEQFASLLPALIGFKQLTLGKAQTIEVLPEPVRPLIKASLRPEGEILVEMQSAGARPFGGAGGLWTFSGTSLRPYGLPATCLELARKPMRVSRQDVPLFLSQTFVALSASAEVHADFDLDDFSIETAEPEFHLHLAGGIAALEAQLTCFYGKVSASELSPQQLWLPDSSNPRVYRARNFTAEQQGLARLIRSGFSGPDPRGRFQLKGQDPVLNFFAREYPRLKNEWKVTLEERLERSTSQNLERIEPSFQVSPSGENWFDLQVSYASAHGQCLTQADIQRLLLSGQSYSRLSNGKFALVDTAAIQEVQEALVDCAPRQHAGGYRMPEVQSGFLHATLMRQPGARIQAPSAWVSKAQQMRGAAQLVVPPLGPLESVLRPYQKEGVAWLRFLRECGFGGVLADDMGLGKTLQVLAHLATLRSQPTSEPLNGPALVVCPSSLVFNWAAEAEKFTPQLRVLLMQGPRRLERLGEIACSDVVVTSYTLLRRDFEAYRSLQFDTAILDEAQHIKNRQTQNAQAVKAVRAGHRLVLTGTPLENSVLDLWSIFDFLMPGYLGAAQDFKERYEVPITREQHAGTRDRLARRVRPFLLRRLKRDVAADLPARLEQVSFCDMTDAQGALYQQILEAGRAEVLNAVGANGLARSRMVVLTTLLRLRQICCHPALLQLGTNGGTEASAAESQPASPARETVSSGKFDLFTELLEEILDGGHRVLVFSQFTRMLGLLKDHLAAEQIEYCYLDGSTVDRGGVVSEFQRSQIPVFLISLKAGGVGLNLTGADTVVHFDPWWNPAVEAQATDRAHRIGQTRVVTSYKLITKNTVEEKILKLQQRKRALLEGILGEEQEFAQALSWDEIQELLA